MVGIFVLGTWGAYALCPSNRPGKLFAATFYVINPFMYARLHSGQVLGQFGYALVPFAVRYIWLANCQPANRIGNSVKGAIATAVVAIFSLHFAFLLLLFALVCFGVSAIASRSWQQAGRAQLLAAVVFGTMFLGLSIYWLNPLVDRFGETYVSSFGPADIEVFSARALRNGAPLGLSVLGLWGFWREGYPEPVYAWLLSLALILVLFAIGIVQLMRGIGPLQRSLSIGIAIFVVVCAIASFGAHADISGEGFRWLYEEAAVVRMYRDSHRLIAPLALAYSMVGGVGAGTLVDRYVAPLGGRRAIQVLVCCFLAAQYTPLQVLHTAGGVENVRFPESWAAVDDITSSEADNGALLVLPWHQFQRLPFTQHAVANPARYYFDGRVVVAENTEIPDYIETQSSDPIQRYIGEVIERRHDLTRFGALVAAVGIKYVVLVKTADHQEYGFLDTQRDLIRIWDADDLTLYQNTRFSGQLFAVSDNDLSGSWQALMDSVERGNEPEFQRVPLALTGGGAEYRVDEPVNSVVWTRSYDGAWRQGSVPARSFLGLSNVFSAPPGEHRIHYGRSRRIYGGYAVSAVFAAVALGCLACSRRRISARRE